MANEAVCLWPTTIDNPFNYFKEFDDWYDWDWKFGHFTCQRMAKLTGSLDNLTDKEAREAINLAALQLVEADPLEIYYLSSDKVSNTKQA